MARLLIILILAAVLALPASADANGRRPRERHVSNATHQPRSAASAVAPTPTRDPSTNPVALALTLAERYWHGTPACGKPVILTSPHQLPNAAYERVTSPEPTDSVVEMWTEVQRCTITINASLWGSWQVDDDSFQWFCDAMTHEVGHLFGHLDSGQTNSLLITYPFLSESSPNFNSVPECRRVTLHYGAQEIRDHEIVRGR